MRILYLSCHAVLAADEVRLFRELGHTVFAPDAGMDPARLGPAAVPDDPADTAAWEAIPCTPGGDRKEHLTREFVRRFDLVVVMHVGRWVAGNAAALSGTRVVWRTIGQSFAAREAELRPYRRAGLRVVRYSPRERTIPGYIGEDAVIRFAKDPAEFAGWTGHVGSTVTFCQAIRERGVWCNYPFYAAVTGRVPHKLFGPGNEGVAGWHGAVPFARLKAELRANRCYFAPGSYPASYTLNFVEAWMTGTPVVAVGPGRGNSPDLLAHALYEVPDLIENGVSGFYSDDAEETVGIMTALLADPGLAARVSAAGRAAAVRHFGKDAIREQWRQFLAAVG